MKMGTKRGMKKLTSYLLAMILIFSSVPVGATGDPELETVPEAPLSILSILGDATGQQIAKITVTTDEGYSDTFTTLPISIPDLSVGTSVEVIVEASEGYRILQSTFRTIITGSNDMIEINASNFETIEVVDDTTTGDPTDGEQPPDDGATPPNDGIQPPDDGTQPPDGEEPIDGEEPVDGEEQIDGEEPVDGEEPPNEDPIVAEEPPIDKPSDSEDIKVDEEVPPGEETTEGAEDLEENQLPYDGIVETGTIEEVSIYYPEPEPQEFSRTMSLMAQILNPGDVDTETLITPTPNMVNTWDVTLRVYGKEASTSSDIVLVIDRSGSMQGTRYANAKTSAKQFVNTLLTGTGASNTRIAVVSFASNVSVNQNFSNNINTLNNAIDNLPGASGYTHTQAALRQAEALLNSSNATYKNIVLLSDGEPTVSFRITNPNEFATIPIPVNQGWDTNTLVPKSRFTTNSTDSNGTIRIRYENLDGRANDKYYNHGNSAIAESGFIKSGTDPKIIYTIAFQAGTTGTPILNTIATPGKAYNAVDANDMNNAFQSIAASIMSAMNNGNAPNIMDQGFQVDTVGPISTVGSSYTLSGTNLTWSIPTLNVSTAGVTGLRYDDPTINYAELKFRMTINDSIIADDAVDITGNFNPFSEMKVTYTDKDGELKSISMEQQTVDPVLIVVKKQVLANGATVTVNADGTGTVSGTTVTDAGRKFFANAKNVSTGADVLNQEIANGQRIIVKNLKLEGRYTVSEVMTGWQILINGTWYPANTSDYGNPTIIVTIGTIEGPVFGGNNSSLTFDINPNSPDAEFTIYNTEEALGKLEVEKVISLQQSANTTGIMAAPNAIQQFTINIAGPKSDSVSLAGGESHTFEKLPYGTYTVSETATGGYTPSYSPSATAEITIRDKYQNIIPKVTVTNTKSVDSLTTDITATKTWVNGNTADHTGVAMTLRRSVGNTTVDVPNPPAPNITPTTGGETTYTYTWTGLDKFDPVTGTEYEYSVKETAEVSGEVEINGNTYTVSYNEAADKVTNTYKADQSEKIGEKIWLGVPTGETKPTVYFELWRSGGAAGTGEKVEDATLVVNDQVNFGPQDIDDGAVNYTYYVKEVNADGTPLVLDDYRVEVNGLTATNTWDPKMGDITVTKTWEGGNPNRPTVYFRLFRTVGTGTPEEVPGNVVKGITNNNSTATWNVDLKNAAGDHYTFSVKEYSNAAGTIEGAPTNYEPTIDGLNVKNTYKAPTTNISFTKDWSGGSTPRPTVYLKLYRTVSQVVEPTEVTGAVVKAIADGETTATWADMPETDNFGELYYYSVKEFKDATGTEEGAPDNYTVSYNNTTRVVTNTFASPKGNFIVNKAWENAPDNKPETWFKLQRSIDGGAFEDFTEGGVKATVNDTTVTWEGIPLQRDSDGAAYTFKAVETNAEGFPWTPAYYEVNITDPELDNDGNYIMTATNTYDEPLNITASKTWVGDPVVTRPDVTITLQRKIEGGEWAAVPGEEVFKPIKTDVSAKSWSDLVREDGDGNPYEYRVIETFDEDLITNQNWVVHYTETFHVLNRVINNNGGEPGDPEDPDNPHHPDEKVGLLKVTKELLNEVNPDYIFKFKVTGPYGVVMNGDKDYFEVKAGQTVEVKDLYYGSYSVEEIGLPAGKYKVTYEGSRTFVIDKTKPNSIVNTLKIINELDDGKFTDITATKIWRNSTGHNISIQLQLYKDGVAFGAPVTIVNTSTYTWRNLDKYRADGTLIRYRVDEINVPSRYTKHVQDDGFTIVNTYIGDDRYIPVPWIFDTGGGGLLLNDYDHIAYVQGYPGGSFRAENSITRAEATMIFARLMVESMNINTVYTNPYNDVPLGKWYSNAIGFLTGKGIIEGYPDGSFRPDAAITRAEFSKLASGFDKLSGGSSNFFDVPASHWAKRFIDNAYTKGWVRGYPDGSFKPDDHIRRSEVVTLVNRMLNRQADKNFIENNPTLIRHYTDLTKSHWAYYDIMEASHTHDYTRPTPNSETWIRIKPNR